MSLCFLSGKVARVLKCLFFFSQFGGGVVGWLLLVYLGLEGLGVFVFLVFAFLVGVGFLSVCLRFVLFCGWILLFLFLFFFLLFGFSVLFLFFSLFLFFLFFFLEGLRVR